MLNSHINLICNICLIILSFFIFPYRCLILTLFTHDGIFYALHYFFKYTNIDLTRSQIVDISSSLYKRGTIDRSIFYLIEYLFYNLVCTFLWINHSNILYYGMIILSLPYILNKILLSNIFQKIANIKEILIKKIIAKQICILIKLSSKVFLERNIKIKKTEILNLIKNYDNDYILDILKNALIIFLLMYVKKCSTTFYYKLTKIGYRYTTGNLLQSFNGESAKETLSEIIENRYWGEFLKPNIYKAILRLYQESKFNQERDYFKEFTVTFSLKLGKFFTIYSFSSFLNNIIIIPILSLFFLLWRNVNKEKWIEVITIILSFVIGILTESIILTSILSVYSKILLYNPITISLLNYLIKKIKKIFIKIHFKNLNYFVQIISNLLFVFLLSIINSYFTLNISFYYILLLFIFYILINNENGSNGYIYSYFVVSGLISNFNIIHLIHNCLVLIVVICIMPEYYDFNFYNTCAKFFKNKYKNYKNYKKYKKYSGDGQEIKIIFKNIKENFSPENYEILKQKKIDIIDNYFKKTNE